MGSPGPWLFASQQSPSLLQGEDDTRSEVQGGEGAKGGFLRHVPTCSPTSLCMSWEEGKSQSSEKAAAWPRAKVVSYSSWMSPGFTNTMSYNSIALILGLDRAFELKQSLILLWGKCM